MAEQILNQYSNKVNSLELLPSSGGVFELSLDDELIFSKKGQGRFPEEEEVIKLIEASA